MYLLDPSLDTVRIYLQILYAFELYIEMFAWIYQVFKYILDVAIIFLLGRINHKQLIC